MPKVSIIIPFNNVETYIDECLQSVINQTLEDIEIILINDASTDKSREIAQKYVNSDKRIKLFDLKERHGQGYARNIGIENATGEYIGFVDSDDFVEKIMFESLYDSAKSNDTDISMCQAKEYDDINEKNILSDYYSLAVLYKFGNSVFSAEDVKDNILDINVALWNKIYKRDYLIKLGEKFPEGYIYEDMPFFFGTFLPAKKVQIVWRNLYSYRINRKNSTMLQFNNKILDRPPMVSLTYEKIKKYPYLNDMKQKIQGWIIDDLFHRYTLLKENFHKEYFFLMKRVFKNLDIEDINDEYWKRVYHFNGYLWVINNNFDTFTQKIFNEYLDIHEIENRLRCEMRDAQSLDNNYQLVKKNFSDAQAKLELSTYDKFRILEEVFNTKIIDNKEEIKKEFNHKIKELYSYTNTEMAKVFNAVKDNYVILDKSINQKVYDMNKLSEEINIKLTEINAEINEKTDIYEVKELLDKYKQEISQVISNYRNDYLKLENDFDAKLNQQRIKYENKLILLETELTSIRNEVQKKKRSFIKRVINKLKKMIKR